MTDKTSSIPTLKIKHPLKELVIREKFNQCINDSSLPSTLESLSILNPEYSHPLHSQNVPPTLTSFRSNSSLGTIDLSQHASIRELQIHFDSFANYPPNLVTLHTDHHWFNKGFQINSANKHLIKKLEIDQSTAEVLDVLPNLEYLKTSHLDTDVPASVTELDIRDMKNPMDACHHYSSPTVQDIHIGLTPQTLRAISLPVSNEIRTKDTGNYNYIPSQLPSIDGFFWCWRNLYIRSMILESVYGYRYNIHLNRSENYNIEVYSTKHLQSIDFYQFKNADQINFHYKEKRGLSGFIPTTVHTLKAYCLVGKIPNWITHLHLVKWNHLKAGDIPWSVTNLRLCSKYGSESNLYKLIPNSVTYLELSDIKSDCIPPSITYLCLVDQPVNTLNPCFIPDTIEKIEFKRFLFKEKARSHDIPPSVASRLENGVFYIYSKYRTAIPHNTTHLFWLDNHQLVDNRSICLPRSVHTLVLGKDFNAPILSLPPTITQMVFSGNFKQPINTICFPPALKYLHFGSVRDIVEQHDLPQGLTHLVIENNGRVKSLPASVHHLQINDRDMMSPDDSLEIPPQVQHVKLGRGLKHVLTAVPSTIKSIISPAPWSDNMVFGEYTEPQDTKSLLNSTTNLHLHGVKYHSFNSFIVPQTLGNNIKSISFGHCFNQVILPGTFPNSVEFLDFGHSFNQPLHKSLLPSSLQTLVLGRGFKQDLKDVFPSTLTQLSLHLFWVSAVQSISQFPPNLIKLSIPYYDGVLGIIPTTTTLVHLELNQVISNFGKFPGDADADIIPIELVPPNITTLILNEYMRIQSYDLIPLTIKNIKLCDSIRPGTKIPITIESVVLPKSFNSPLGTILQTVDNCDQ